MLYQFIIGWIWYVFIRAGMLIFIKDQFYSIKDSNKSLKFKNREYLYFSVISDEIFAQTGVTYCHTSWYNITLSFKIITFFSSRFVCGPASIWWQGWAMWYGCEMCSTKIKTNSTSHSSDNGLPSRPHLHLLPRPLYTTLSGKPWENIDRDQPWLTYQKVDSTSPVHLRLYSSSLLICIPTELVRSACRWKENSLIVKETDRRIPVNQC